MSWPEHPKALLEARYNAFVNGDIDFLIESHHPDTRGQVHREAIAAWSRESKWLGLNIDSVKSEKDKALIEFSILFEREFERIKQSEKAEFRLHENKWHYFDSEFVKPETVRREGVKLGRNDPCSCGSKKKFKKCCGAQ